MQGGSALHTRVCRDLMSCADAPAACAHLQQRRARAVAVHGTKEDRLSCSQLDRRAALPAAAGAIGARRLEAAPLVKGACVVRNVDQRLGDGRRIDSLRGGVVQCPRANLDWV